MKFSVLHHNSAADPPPAPPPANRCPAGTSDGVGDDTGEWAIVLPARVRQVREAQGIPPGRDADTAGRGTAAESGGKPGTGV